MLATPSASSGSREALAGSEALAKSLERPEGEHVLLPKALRIAGREYRSAKILREFRTKSRARLLQLEPGSVLFIAKFENVFPEYAVMAALRQLNKHWQKHRLFIGSEPVQASTFGVFPMGPTLGLVEVVPHSRTLRELSEGIPFGERQYRVLRALGGDTKRLDRLAASVCAYLTSGYVLGIRDGHDDNLMLHRDGNLFRVDFGFAFGRTPEIDAPGIFVPNAVAVALGEPRWRQVMCACKEALHALGSRPGRPPAWDCLAKVPELKAFLHDVHEHTSTLSLQNFEYQVAHATEWTLQRAAKNTLREAVRYITAESEVKSDEWIFDPFGFMGTSQDSSPSSGYPRARRAEQSAPPAGGHAQALPAPGSHFALPVQPLRGWAPAVPVRAAPPPGAGGLARGPP